MIVLRGVWEMHCDKKLQHRCNHMDIKIKFLNNLLKKWDTYCSNVWKMKSLHKYVDYEKLNLK